MQKKYLLLVILTNNLLEPCQQIPSTVIGFDGFNINIHHILTAHPNF